MDGSFGCGSYLGRTTGMDANFSFFWPIFSYKHTVTARSTYVCHISISYLLSIFLWVVLLLQVMGSKTKIFIVMEFVTGGELFDKIVSAELFHPFCFSEGVIFLLLYLQILINNVMKVNHGRMREDEARRYFHQLINAVDYCHSRGVYHRDLKVIAYNYLNFFRSYTVHGLSFLLTNLFLCSFWQPENLLLDAYGNLKVSDFGLSALSKQVKVCLCLLLVLEPIFDCAQLKPKFLIIPFFS